MRALPLLLLGAPAPVAAEAPQDRPWGLVARAFAGAALARADFERQDESYARSQGGAGVFSLSLGDRFSESFVAHLDAGLTRYRDSRLRDDSGRERTLRMKGNFWGAGLTWQPVDATFFLSLGGVLAWANVLGHEQDAGLGGVLRFGRDFFLSDRVGLSASSSALCLRSADPEDRAFMLGVCHFGVELGAFWR